MKRFILFGLLLVGATMGLKAQDISKHALGLRLGDSDGFGAEISYQLGLNPANRLEFDLGWRDSNDYDAFKLTGLYQWVFPLDGNFNWYVGAGGGLGSYDYDDDRFDPAFDFDDSGSFFFAAGDIGIEYNFNIPLLLSLDFRPELGFGDFNDDLDFDIALGIRYQFN
ncbi:porin family protein [Robertkochia aurantiaca]|uniref:porin family protein n=1 Tax=Robertkochia aurantiaca TaxID=2873700 RepID=UPI001CCC4810|nr:porin family protein [Robertkochia sp. 3YJGBD-33]